MAGATAAASVATPHVQAQTAQISLLNNDIDSVTGNHLSLSITSGYQFGSLGSFIKVQDTAHLVIASLRLNSHHFFIPDASARDNVQRGHYYEAIIGANFATGPYHTGSVPQQAFDLYPLKLTDPNVDDDQTNTNALLEVECFNQTYTDQTVALLAIFYPESGNTTPDLTINEYTGAITGSYTNVGSSDDGVYTAAVPEPSGLALLALGAGGILAARKRGKFASSDKVPSQDN